VLDLHVQILVRQLSIISDRIAHALVRMRIIFSSSLVTSIEEKYSHLHEIYIIVILVNVFLVLVGVLAAMRRSGSLAGHLLQILAPISHGRSFCSQDQPCSRSVSVRAEPNHTIQIQSKLNLLHLD
jgi:hypothetical protein